jgi:hypothetical protein
LRIHRQDGIIGEEIGVVGDIIMGSIIPEDDTKIVRLVVVVFQVI